MTWPQYINFQFKNKLFSFGYLNMMTIFLSIKQFIFIGNFGPVAITQYFHIMSF